MQEQIIDSLVAKIAQELKGQNTAVSSAPQPIQKSAEKPVLKPIQAGENQEARFTTADYPLLEKHCDIIKTPTGKPISDITLEALVKGDISVEDVRISAEMLLNQADIAESAGKKQVAENLRRAAEMTRIEDDVVIKMYDMLRPNRATKAELTEMAETLENRYHANRLAQLVTEACEVYEKRGILLK